MTNPNYAEGQMQSNVIDWAVGLEPDGPHCQCCRDQVHPNESPDQLAHPSDHLEDLAASVQQHSASGHTIDDLVEDCELIAEVYRSPDQSYRVLTPCNGGFKYWEEPDRLSAARTLHQMLRTDVEPVRGTHNHLQVPAHCPLVDEVIHVDEKLRPLLVALWRLGVWTVMSCQDNVPKGHAWIMFGTRREADWFAGACREVVRRGQIIVKYDGDTHASVRFPAGKIKWLVTKVNRLRKEMIRREAELDQVSGTDSSDFGESFVPDECRLGSRSAESASGWRRVGVLPLRSGRLRIADPVDFYRGPEADQVIELPPGNYLASIASIGCRKYRHTSRFRLATSSNGELGELLTRVRVGTGTICVFDDELGDDVLTTVRTGFGDGIYPVFEVVQEGRRVGIEAVFLGDDDDID